MKVKLNKQLIIESDHLQAFLDDVNAAAERSHSPGVPTVTDSINKFMSDNEKTKHIMTPEQIKEANMNTGDILMNPNYNKGIK